MKIFQFIWKSFTICRDEAVGFLVNVPENLVGFFTVSFGEWKVCVDVNVSVLWTQNDQIENVLCPGILNYFLDFGFVIGLWLEREGKI